MANEAIQRGYSFKANADLSAKQYCFVKLTANNTVDVCSATTDVPIGVLQNKPTSGQNAAVTIDGITKIVAAATIAAGALIATDASGHAASGVAGTDTTKYLVGQVIDASNGANSLLTAAISCFAPGRGA